MSEFSTIRARIAALESHRRLGRIDATHSGTITVKGLADVARVGDRVRLQSRDGARTGGEVVDLSRESITVLPDAAGAPIAIHDSVEHVGRAHIAPGEAWIGRVVDPFGEPLDGRPLAPGPTALPLQNHAPAATTRRRLGPRLDTGNGLFNTLLPLVRGQRLGLFAGSGVGKSRLLGQFARGIAADVVVIALVGERGREVREFVESVLGPEGMARTVVVAATSDQSPLVRRQAAWAAMAVAESFRDMGRHVLLLADSVTRFVQAHREVALAAGEPASLRGYPPSSTQAIMSLAERAGPGREGTGDITAVFTVLVAASDMEEPVADTLRGVLDGHVVLDRTIAERGRFPAVDVLRSVSRSLPNAASAEENALIGRARQLLGAYERAEMMIQAGLYVAGSDPLTDAAISAWPALDSFMADATPRDVEECFAALAQCLEHADATPGDTAAPQEPP